MTNSQAKLLQAKNRRSSRQSKPNKPKTTPRTVSVGKKPKFAPKPPKLSKLRLLLVWLVLLGGMLGLSWRLYGLQVKEAAQLQKKARIQQTTNLRPYIPRRSIIDNQGNVLATDQLAYTVYAHPKLFKQSEHTNEEVANKLAPILGTTPQQLLEQFNKKETGIKLATNLPESVAKQIRDMQSEIRLDGLDLNEEYNRFYPQDETVADIIGYVDRDHKGQAGLELSQKQLLERNLLNLYIRRTGNGVILPASLPENNLSFDELQLELTIDMRLQRAARSALKEQLKKYNAKRGAVLVMDSSDGSLLALVCEPTFNPNEYYKSKVELFKNWTVSDLYEPGSTFKPINIAIALDAGVIEPNTRVFDSGSVTVDGWQIFNASKRGNGSISIAQVLQTSSNVGMVQIMSRMNKKDYYHNLQKLGLGEKTGIELPGEISGHLKDEQTFTRTNIETAVTAFGQGFSLTPVKLIQLHGSLANGGKLVTPHLIKGLADPKGHLHWQPDYPVKQVLSIKNTRKVVEMMETVVTEGTGEPAKIAHYRIGGKTGTAQKAGAKGGYIPNAKITSFVAILPVDSPRYVVLAVVDEPKGGNTFGSTVAAPIAKSVMEALISIQGIPPSKGGQTTGKE